MRTTLPSPILSASQDPPIPTSPPMTRIDAWQWLCSYSPGRRAMATTAGPRRPLPGPGCQEGSIDLSSNSGVQPPEKTGVSQ